MSTCCKECGVDCISQYGLKEHAELHKRIKESSSFWERTWCQAKLQLDELEGNPLFKELDDAMRACEKAGNLELGTGRPRKKKPAEAPALKKSPAKKTVDQKICDAHQKLGIPKKKPPQPPGKPHWDSKHGRWTDNPKFSMEEKAAKPKAKSQPKPKPKSGIIGQSYEPVSDEPAGPD